MKNRIKASLLVLVAMLLVFYCTIWYFTPKPSFWQSYKGQFEYKNLNINEINVIDSLKKEEFDSIEIYKPLIGLHGPYGSNVYNVILKQKNILNSKPEKKKEFKNLAINLYKNVISNMFIEDMEYISIQYNYCFKTNNKKYCDEKYYTFYKDSLEIWCGFKVLKVDKNNFKRIKII